MSASVFHKIWITGSLLGLSIISCKKDDTTQTKSEKYRLVAGTWSQKDIVLGVSAKIGSQTLPAGTSVIALAPLLGAAGPLLTCSKTNTYTFTPEGNFTINGCTDLILPKAGVSGNWKLDIYDAVLQLNTEKNGRDPHWIEEVTDSTLKVDITVTIPGVGTAPLVLQLKKQ